MFFFFNDTATTEIYTLSLHDALPIYKTIADNPVLSGRKARLFEHRSGGARQIRNEVCADGHHIDCRVIFHEFSEQRQFDLARTAGHPPKMNNRGVTGV